MKSRRKLLLLCVSFFLFCSYSYSQSPTISLLDEQILRLTILDTNLQTLKQDLQTAEQKLEIAETQLVNVEAQLDASIMNLNDSQERLKTLSETLKQSEQKLKIWKTLSISFMTSTVITTTIILILVR